MSVLHADMRAGGVPYFLMQLPEGWRVVAPTRGRDLTFPSVPMSVMATAELIIRVDEHGWTSVKDRHGRSGRTVCPGRRGQE